MTVCPQVPPLQYSYRVPHSRVASDALRAYYTAFFFPSPSRVRIRVATTYSDHMINMIVNFSLPKKYHDTPVKTKVESASIPYTQRHWNLQ